MVKKRHVKQFTTALMLIAALVLFGCRSTPIYNVSDAPVNTNTNEYTTENVKKAIIKAGVVAGWQIRVMEPGKLSGTLHMRHHTAKIDILYSTTGYSLLYNDSDQLNYNVETGEIHKNYNVWIQNLDRTIQSQLLAL